ncbi:hypothetical protein L9G15_13990 [Shewanella sp. A3A]|nr:hypothetical protein [Shewanella ferrihydritica]
MFKYRSIWNSWSVAIVVLGFLSNIATANSLDDDKVNSLVSLCIKKTLQVEGGYIDNVDDIDRVYVAKMGEQVDLSLYHGEVGYFGEPSINAKFYCTCGVINKNNPNIDVIFFGISRDVFGDKKYKGVPFGFGYDDVGSTISLFLKKDGRFIHSKTLVYSFENIWKKD